MTLPVWPETVPHAPLTSSAQFVSHQAPLKTEMNSGDVRMRKRFTKRISPVQFTIKMTSAQVETLRTFVYDDLSEGSSKFTMPVFGPAGCADKTAQLADGTFNASKTAGGWLVSLQLLVEDF